MSWLLNTEMELRKYLRHLLQYIKNVICCTFAHWRMYIVQKDVCRSFAKRDVAGSGRFERES